MNVVHALTAVFIAVEHDTVAGFIYFFGCSNFFGSKDHFAHEFCIGIVQIIYCRNRMFCGDDDMSRSFRIDIAEGDHVIIFVDDSSGNFSDSNFFEKCHDLFDEFC